MPTSYASANAAAAAVVYGSHGALGHTEPYDKYHQRSVLGGFSSFEADSLPDCSEFDTESVTLEYARER